VTRFKLFLTSYCLSFLGYGWRRWRFMFDLYLRCDKYWLRSELKVQVDILFVSYKSKASCAPLRMNNFLLGFSSLGNHGENHHGFQRVRFNRHHFTIFRAEVWKDIDFWVDIVARNSNKLQKLGLEHKNQLSPQCVHTWANGTGYTSRSEPAASTCAPCRMDDVWTGNIIFIS
jgi:hypothetical protein